MKRGDFGSCRLLLDFCFLSLSLSLSIYFSLSFFSLSLSLSPSLPRCHALHLVLKTKTQRMTGANENIKTNLTREEGRLRDLVGLAQLLTEILRNLC